MGPAEGSVLAKFGHWGLVFLISAFGSVAGWLIDHQSREKDAGQVLKLDRGRLIRFMILGVFVGFVAFLLLTTDRDPRNSDFVIAGLAALKGAEILTSLAVTASAVLSAAMSPKK